MRSITTNPVLDGIRVALVGSVPSDRPLLAMQGLV